MTTNQSHLVAPPVLYAADIPKRIHSMLRQEVSFRPIPKGTPCVPTDCAIFRGRKNFKTGELKPLRWSQGSDAQKRSATVARIVYALAYGECPANMIVRRLCRVPECVNAEHMVTENLNVRYEKYS